MSFNSWLLVSGRRLDELFKLVLARSVLKLHASSSFNYLFLSYYFILNACIKTSKYLAEAYTVYCIRLHDEHSVDIIYLR